MTASQPDNETIFHAARDIPDSDRRREYVREACGGDEARIAHVKALLAAADAPDSLLDRPAGSGPVATINQPTTERPGTVIGPYKLLQQIGEGGMGRVYMAEQTQPVQRKVALKIIKPGMDSRQVIARFEAERQALAVMDHVNIARVFDGGTTQNGRPYFVMELVHGVPITKYCDDNHLTPRERLELFVPVCQAIQHAHQKGIIHRDVKPSNVMVTLYDGKPVPKVIDFGVAKATEQKLTERTLFTQYGTMVGTLEYMSPEQAEMSALGVDTRSDIYSLGVLLYELLTGSTPLTHKRMKDAAYGEILRMIKEEEPPKPSTRLSDSGEALASISANRHTEPAKLTKLVKGELDWIVMKTLEKDRNRRYETANGLAADVNRYLHDEAVQACPPSALYRFRKFARRNKVALAIAMTVTLAVLVAVGSIGWVVRDRSARHAKLSYGVEIAVQAANLARGRALARTDNPFDWDAALASALSALKGAEELAAQDAAALDPAVVERLQRMRATLDGDETDRRFVARFDEILRGLIVWDARRSQSKNEEAFFKLKDAFQSCFAWDVGATPTAEVASFIQQRPKPIQEHLLAALDAGLARVPKDRPQAQQWLANVLQAADPDPWRKQAREALAAQDWAELEKLLNKVNVARQRPALLHLLSSSLPWEAMVTKDELLRRIRETYPGEFWAHGRFAMAMSHDMLAWHLATIADPKFRDEKWALELAMEAVRLAPNDGDFWNTLGVAHYRMGNWNEAVRVLEKAMELSKGGRADDWFFLAMAHWRLGNRDAARGSYDQAVEWIQKQKSSPSPLFNEALRRFRAEAAELLGIKSVK
jgi:eukaryotic-like serine/threonine-protein kinase